MASKVQRMRTHVQALKADMLLVSMLDEVRLRALSLFLLCVIGRGMTAVEAG